VSSIHYRTLDFVQQFRGSGLSLVQAIKLGALKTANFSMDFLICNIALHLLQACVSINNRKKRGTNRIAGNAHGGPLAKSPLGRGLKTAALVLSPAQCAYLTDGAERETRADGRGGRDGDGSSASLASRAVPLSPPALGWPPGRRSRSRGTRPLVSCHRPPFPSPPFAWSRPVKNEQFVACRRFPGAHGPCPSRRRVVDGTRPGVHTWIPYKKNHAICRLLRACSPRKKEREGRKTVPHGQMGRRMPPGRACTRS
jgi:hypothetical protein